MKVAVLGGTKGMGRSLARLFAARGDTVCLLGRDQADLDKSAEDLRSRGKADVSVLLCDLEKPYVMDNGENFTSTPNREIPA